MDFELSDDQVALRDAATDLLGDRASLAAVRAHTESDAPYDKALWAAMVEQGWLGVAIPESDGGLGLGLVELAVLLEALGGHCAPAPYLPTVLAAGACQRAGLGGAVEALLSGDSIGCVGWTRRAGAVTARRDGTGDGTGDGWLLDGRTDPVPYAPVANVALIAATVGGEGGAAEPELFAVSLDEVGRPARETAMDVTRPLGWLRFDGTPAQRVGDASHARALLDHGAALTAAEMLGGAQAVLDMAVDYAKDRVQFGRPIGSFQAVKHRCADMLVDVEGMRSTAYWAAWSLGHDPADEASVAASTAKCWASDASKRVMASGLQVHGGIGFTWEHDLHFFMKRAQLDQLEFGDASFHRARLTALLRPRVERGESVV
ncbi:MAG TPA: acyl-CoA dehydrogenase family protein [Acidimicrobiia bacterium]